MKEHEIRPRSLLERYIEVSVQDIPRFFDRAEFVETSCPGCDSESAEPAFEKNGFPYVECSGCGSLYVSPRPSREALDRYYRESQSSRFWASEFYPTTAEARREKIFRPRAERIRERFAKENVAVRVVIDVGSGFGIFAEELRKTLPGVEVRGVEPGRTLAEVSRSRGIEVLECTVEEAGAWAGQADLVTSFEVIEHVHRPEDFIGAIRKLLKPGGTALVSGLGIDGFDTQVLWERSKSIQPPHHLNFLSVSGFEQVFRRAGFAAVEVQTPGLLDVDIVLNMLKEDAGLPLDRFHRLLLQRRGPDVHAKFQQFLQEARLSSHVWVWGSFEP